MVEARWDPRIKYITVVTSKDTREREVIVMQTRLCKTFTIRCERDKTLGNFVSIYKKAVGGACKLCKIAMYSNRCVTSAFKVRYCAGFCVQVIAT